MKIIRNFRRLVFLIVLVAIFFGAIAPGELTNSEAERLLRSQYPRYLTANIQINDFGLSPSVPNELEYLRSAGMALYKFIPPGTKGYGCYGNLTPFGEIYLVKNLGEEFVSMAIAKVELEKITGIREMPEYNRGFVEYVEKVTEITPVGEMYSDLKIGVKYGVDADFTKYNDGWRLEKMYTTAREFSLQEKSVTPDTTSVRIKSAKKVYDDHCMMCHGRNGEGLVGPNLTDKYWVNGNSFNDIFQIITKGNAVKGMISYQQMLPALSRLNMTNYILYVLQNSNPPNPKKPEGTLR